MRSPLVLAVVALSTLGHVSAQAQEPGALPKAETVLADYIKATGGEEAYKKCKNRSLSGTIEIPAQNVTGKVQILQAAPNLISVTSEVPNVLKQVQATDGKNAWELNNLTGDRLYQGAEKDEFLRRAVFNEELQKKELNDKI
jgi:predicted transglutaminase-like cysteine proteinase